MECDNNSSDIEPKCFVSTLREFSCDIHDTQKLHGPSNQCKEMVGVVEPTHGTFEVGFGRIVRHHICPCV